MEVRKDSLAKSDSTGAWYLSAVVSAWVAAAFSLIVIVCMCNNLYQMKVVDVRLAEELETMQTEYSQQGQNEQLLSRIRQLDLQNRRSRIERLGFSRMGAYLLLGGLAVFVSSLKSAVSLERQVPLVGAAVDERSRQWRESVQSRLAVTICMLFLVSVGVFLAFKSWVDFAAGGEAVSPYPSMQEVNANWAGFRGPNGAGVSAYSNIPLRFDGKSGEGVLWKSKVPLGGHNSPVAWSGRVFVSGADENNRRVYCFDGVSGKLLWTGDVKAVARGDGQAFEPMEDTGFAASTVVTDGRRVCAIFANGDIGCFTFEGRTLWSKSLGVPDSMYGYASSLASYEKVVLVQYDQGSVEDEKSRLIALDWFTGRVVWEAKRPVPNSWTSPIVAKVGDSYQIITCGNPWVIAYDPASGAEIWRAQCIGGDVAPSPVYGAGNVFAIEPYNLLVALKVDGARGDISESNIAWTVDDEIPDICSPVSSGEFVFLLTTEGMLTCFKAEDGTKVWDKDINETFMASPCVVGDKLFLLSNEGVMFIVEAGGREYKEIGRNELGEDCYASCAFADGRMYIRGVENLYCIGNVD